MFSGGPGSVPGSFRFEGSSSTGAILILPEGGIRKDLLSTRLFQDYATRNAASWYQFATGSKLGRPAQNGSLYLITGCDKSPAWGVASYYHPFSRAKVSCEFMGTEVGDGHPPGYHWINFRPATVRVSRLDHSGSSQARGDPNPRPTLNQCIFVRGFRISLELRYWRQLLGYKVKIEDGIDFQIDEAKDGKRAAPFLPAIHDSSPNYGNQNSNQTWRMDAVNEHDILLENISSVSNVSECFRVRCWDS